MNEKAARTAIDVYRDFGKLVDELAELKTPAGHIVNHLGRESRLPAGVAFLVAQAAASRNLPPMPDFSTDTEKPRSRTKILDPGRWLGLIGAGTDAKKRPASSRAPK
jgi:hypothetical protein